LIRESGFYEYYKASRDGKVFSAKRNAMAHYNENARQEYERCRSYRHPNVV